MLINEIQEQVIARKFTIASITTGQGLTPVSWDNYRFYKQLLLIIEKE